MDDDAVTAKGYGNSVVPETMDRADARRIIQEIRPHFIFNVLNNLRYWTRKDADKAYDMVYDLANYLRVSMAALTEEEPIPLKEEIRRMQSYLDLEMMMNRNFHVIWEWDSISGENELTVVQGELYGAARDIIQKSIQDAAEPRTLKIDNRIEKGDYMIRFTVVEEGLVKQWCSLSQL